MVKMSRCVELAVVGIGRIKSQLKCDDVGRSGIITDDRKIARANGGRVRYLISQNDL